MVRQARAEQWHSVVIRVGLLNRDQQEVLDAVDALLNRVEQLEAQAVAQVDEAERAVVIYPALVFLLTLIFAGTLVHRVTASVTHPVQRLMEGASQLAAGSFDRRVPVESEDEIGQLAKAFNSMAAELQLHYLELEERVAERTRALETSLQIGRRLSTILDQETLTQEVVDQIQQAFDYYHVHIYLFDISRQYLLMGGGTGEAGRAMLLRGHRLNAGQGLVGRAADRNEVTLVADVSEADDWLPNPLLPDTKTELAVPITFGGKVRGVLDVQHNVRSGLDSSDADLLQIIAAQVAVALHNAELMAQVQTRAERAAKINAISQRIQQATSVEQVLQTAVQELGHTLRVDSAYIELKTPRSASDLATVAESGSGNG
jgi:nitrate/nitrite-specific signal transduction histidine kinase